MSRSIRLTLVAAAMSAGVASVTHAAELTYEGFTGYSTAGGSNDLVGNTGGTGFGGAWASPDSDGFLRTVRTPTAIAYPGYDGSSTPAASGGNYLNLAAAFGGANPFRVFRPLDTAGGGVYDTNGFISGGKIGADNKTLWGSILFSNNAAQTNGTGAASIAFDGTVSNSTIVLFQPSASNLLVFRFDFSAGATDTITTFANPNLATFDGTTGGVTSAPGDYAFTALRLTESYANGNNGAETQFDDIRFGSTLADVAPAIPEPTSIAILGIATIGLLARRRRNA